MPAAEMLPVAAFPPPTPSTAQVAPRLLGSPVTDAANCCCCEPATTEAHCGCIATVTAGGGGGGGGVLNDPPQAVKIASWKIEYARKIQRTWQRAISPPQ